MSYLTAIKVFIGGLPARVVLTIIGIIVGLFVWNHVIDLYLERDAAVLEAKNWKKKAEDLGVRINSVDNAQKNREEKFVDLDRENIDLICMARYEVPPIRIEGPVTVPEVLVGLCT